jgi:short-subunit dehydrogenase
MQWADKVVLITGASQGIGASCAKLFQRRGARLSLTALPEEGLEDADEPSRLVVTGDITQGKTRKAIVEGTVNKYGRIDILINNAGAGQYGYPSEVDIEISKRIFDVNVFSALALAQLVIPHMRREGSPSIVNVGSVAGKVSLPWAVMYCAAKWALHCVDDSLRRELEGTGIRVMKVCPGIVDTKFRDHVFAGKAPEPVKDIQWVVSPDEVAEGLLKGLEKRKRTVFVPRIGLLFTSLEFFAPRVMDWYLRQKM